MSGEEVRELIEVVIEYIPYIYPGVISVAIYNFCNAIYGKDIKLFFIKSICVGYAYNLVLNNICFAFLRDDLIYNIVLCIISIITPVMLYKIIRSKFVIKVLNLINIRTSIIDNDLEEMCTGEKYNYIRIYIKDKPLIYEGYVRTFEKDSSRKQYVILNDYKIKYYNEKNYKETTIIEHRGYAEDKIIIYMEDIKNIEKHSYERIYQDK